MRGGNWNTGINNNYGRNTGYGSNNYAYGGSNNYAHGQSNTFGGAGYSRPVGNGGYGTNQYSSYNNPRTPGTGLGGTGLNYTDGKFL